MLERTILIAACVFTAIFFYAAIEVCLEELRDRRRKRSRFDRREWASPVAQTDGAGDLLIRSSAPALFTPFHAAEVARD